MVTEEFTLVDKAILVSSQLIGYNLSNDSTRNTEDEVKLPKLPTSQAM